jgi:hypothetical protein
MAVRGEEVAGSIDAQVRESVEKRFGIVINDSRVVSHYGGSRAVLGGDTAWVFYARYAQ